MTTSNRKRAKRVLAALKTNEAYEVGLDTRSAIIDALTDLRHACDAAGLGFGELDRVAHQHYLAEIQGATKQMRRIV